MVNPGALKRLVAGGTQLRPFSNEVLEACLKATNELWGEISAKNPDFKKSIAAMQAYRSDEYLWWQVAEYSYDSFMIRSRTRGCSYEDIGYVSPGLVREAGLFLWRCAAV